MHVAPGSPDGDRRHAHAAAPARGRPDGAGRTISTAVGTATVVALLGATWVLTGLFGVAPVTWVVRGAVTVALALLVRRWLRRLHAADDRETDVRRAEQQLSTQREVIIQTVSHEFRTPLAVIQGAAETLLARDLEPDQQQALLVSLRNAAQRLGDLTSTVLAIAEPLGRDAQEVVEVDRVIADLASELERLRAPDRVNVRRDPDADTLVTDPNRIRLIVRALMENGLRFSGTDQPVEVLASRNGVTFSMRVRDHGPGMSPQIAERAFEPLVQGDASLTREHGGLGLGLFAARQATVQLGGDIELVPREDGVDVVIRLPQRRESDRVHRPRVQDNGDLTRPT